MKRAILVSLLFLLRTIPAFAGDTLHVLFIGNSFTGVNDLPEQTRLIAASKGDILIKTAQANGGYTLQMYTTDAPTLALIDNGTWDCVVLQEQSQLPAFGDQQVAQDVYPYAKILVDRIRQHNPCSKIMFYMTWGYKNGDASNCAGFPPICTYLGMDSLLRLRYMAMADSNNTLLCPVGSTWRRIRALYPAINLYDADEHHPSPEGTYAGACSFYSALFHKTPVGATYTFSLNATDAANIQNAAKSVVQDSLTFWQHWWQPTAPPHAGFTQVVTGRTVQFTNASQQATSYSWFFGDGGTAASQNPAHTYTANGSYNVRLIAGNACGNADTLNRTVAVNAAGLNNLSGPDINIVVYPNPLTDQLHIAGLGGLYTGFELRDITGRSVLQYAITNGSDVVQANIQLLPAGSYQLLLKNKAGAIGAVFKIGKIN